MKKYLLLAVFTALIAIATFVSVGSAQADVLWYNGDTSLSNNQLPEGTNVSTFPYTMHDGTIQYVPGIARVYEDFDIWPGQTWNIDTIWANYALPDITFTQVYWEIRDNMGFGNAGTLLYSGISTATQTLTGDILNAGYNNGLPVWRLEVTGLTGITLTAPDPVGPNRYYLSITPYDSGNGSAYITSTTGANAIGSPIGDLESYYYVPGTYNYVAGYYNFVRIWCISGDYSMGLAGSNGSNVPEPATIALVGLGIIPFLRRKRR